MLITLCACGVCLKMSRNKKQITIALRTSLRYAFIYMVTWLFCFNFLRVLYHFTLNNDEHINKLQSVKHA